MGSYKNTSSGGSGHGDYAKIGENKAHVPPAGSSNSYERALKGMESSDKRALAHGHFTREKMSNK